MTIIEGQIETLKSLKQTLEDNGIKRFSSIGDINAFVKNYANEKELIHASVDIEIKKEVENLKIKLSNFQNTYSDQKADILAELKIKQHELQEATTKINNERKNSFLHRLLLSPKAKRLARETINLENNLEKIIEKRLKGAKKLIDSSTVKLNEILENKERIAADRVNKAIDDLGRTREIIDDLYPVIAGAIGENAVVKILSELSDDYYLINDFSVEFDPPIYNKKEKDRIHSIQADHLLVSKAGIFLLETKNWSEKSLRSLDLRSPVEQIKRTSYALFVLLNSDSNSGRKLLDGHHWGSKKIPIKSVIVMTNGKPRGEFKNVKVLTLAELNGYIQYFDELFDSKETKRIFEYLKE